MHVYTLERESTSLIYRNYCDTPSCDNYIMTKAIIVIPLYKNFYEMHGKFNKIYRNLHSIVMTALKNVLFT